MGDAIVLMPPNYGTPSYRLPKEIRELYVKSLKRQQKRNMFWKCKNALNCWQGQCRQCFNDSYFNEAVLYMKSALLSE